jgi:hypothetical protein
LGSNRLREILIVAVCLIVLAVLVYAFVQRASQPPAIPVE